MKNKKITILFALLIIISCAKNNINLKKDEDIYQEGMRLLKMGVYDMSAKEFERIDEEYPFEEYARKGLIMSAYAYYKSKEYEDSLRIIEYYTKIYPFDKYISYMYYLAGMSYYDRITSYKRARDLFLNAKLNFSFVKLKYPTSEFIEDIDKRLVAIDTFLAGNELVIAMQYLDKKNYSATINRLQEILRNYPKSKLNKEIKEKVLEIESYMN